MALYILIAVIVLLLVFVFKTYNGLISMRNNLRNAWSDIDVQLTRRHDLVPNLVESVKGYMTHERQTRRRSLRHAPQPCRPVVTSFPEE